MSDLVLGLLVLGVCLFAGVLLYNRWQERSAKGAAERAFGSRHADALMDTAPPPARREPTLQTQPSPDERVDYVIELQKPIAAALVHEAWRPIEQRFGRRALLVQAEDGSWRAALQMVSRSGVVSDAELIEFRSEVETLGARLGTPVSAPEMRHALEAARELDRTCAENDIQVALHVVGPAIEPALGEQPFQVVRRENGLTLVLDVAVTPDLARSYEAMARAGRSLAESHGARLVDDRGNALDERSLAAIGGQLEAVRQALAGHGIETGSPLALRLFS
jgi:ZipA, C-terminal FtsZ-binding domain